MSTLVFRELNDIDIIIEESVEFNVLNKNRYFELFNNKVLYGNIRKDISFFDDRWVMIVGGIEKVIMLPSEVEMKRLSNIFETSIFDFQLAYRSFIIYNMQTHTTIMAFNNKMKSIANYKEDVTVDIIVKNSIEKFINYIKIPEKSFWIFEKILGNVEEKEIGERVLPEFEEIFLFSDIINDIVENHNLLDYTEYLLSIMWWKICSILPLRPTEFLRTKFKCIYEEDNKFYLKVRRSKGKSGDRIRNISLVDEYYREDIINIDKTLFNLITKYQNILKSYFKYEKETELFPFLLLKEVKYRKNSENKRENNLNIITAKDLEINLNRFYKDIVEKKYGLKSISKYIKRENCLEYIGQLKPYDARHVAIINLILIGTDVLEVMYLAGHKNINTAYSYFNHVKIFSKGYALGYARSIAMKNMEKKPNEVISKLQKNKGKEDFNRILDIVEGVKFQPKKVEGGYCYYHDIERDKSFCFLYERNHPLCQYFREESKEVLEKEINKVEKLIDADVKVLIDLIKDMNGISKFHELYQTTSYRLSQRIYDLSTLNRKMIMED
ncbi:site-specific integrase [Clostridium butyricum]|uniref:Phage integrase family protein n=1 Tax=Clostridium butyricum E4 str. BoNT E BL5262 TaxID=632245 RepID=C4IG92_CLOBU|nr:site-specific integrase [Clostridium butyricum]EDT73850.1 hypothetical protein CBY_2662 [Clostridium butyricum 5521]EEP53035.1 hypothetical protein CLP_2104 [Clostridium butyricum E4 str. BoNT E BL5262]NFL31915.1 site-specific integrase [Clostridium butyricum]NFS19398.1 site-specific integrase [Clostridium butyricum]